LIVGWRSAIPTATATAMTRAVNAPRHFSIIEAAEVVGCLAAHSESRTLVIEGAGTRADRRA
jgi:hypothetical protein